MKGKCLPKKQDLDYQDDFVIGMHMTQDPHGFEILKMIGFCSCTKTVFLLCGEDRLVQCIVVNCNFKLSLTGSIMAPQMTLV